jgi:AraC-like DNA-binding protein
LLGQVYIPHPALQEFVLQIITVEADLPHGMQEVVTPYPPTPLQSLMFYGDDRIRTRRQVDIDFEVQPSIVIVGPQYTRINLKVYKRLRAIRVDFRPGGLYRLLGMPMQELFDGGFNASDVIGYEMEGVNQEILNAPDLESAKKRVEQYLLKNRSHLKEALPFDDALWGLLQSGGAITIDKMASDACLSLRQFERKCKERLGMPPKAFARIVRFSKAYRLREAYPHLTWTTIAYEAGYFDQMHLIRDFKEFAGVTPTLLEEDIARTPFRMQAHLLK